MIELGLPSTAEVDAALADAYARPELSPPAPPGWRVWLVERLNQLLDWVVSLLPTPQIGEGGAGALSWAVIVVIALIAVAALLRVTRALATARGAAPRSGTGAGAGATARAEGVEDWRERARMAADAGRWREAALALYHALLLRFDAEGAVRYHPAKTPGDYRREVRRDPRASSLLERFLGPFEPVAFGARALDAEGFARLSRLVDEERAHG
jgi:hypothetical protein